MDDPQSRDIPYDQIENGALILWLLRDCKTWESLCERFLYASPPQKGNTNAMTLRDKLVKLREDGLVTFAERDAKDRFDLGDIEATDLWAKIRVALGGMSLSEAALISRHAKGMAVSPVFDRPRKLDEALDVFVLMPFNAKMSGVYTEHIKKLGPELGIVIQRSDEVYSERPFMDKVWDSICAAKLIVADCTESNPNVFYEIGIAHTLGKKVALITRSANDIPSDIKHFDCIEYSGEGTATEQLLDKLRKFITRKLGLGSPANLGNTPQRAAST
jgi:hypothetical protein